MCLKYRSLHDRTRLPRGLTIEPYIICDKPIPFALSPSKGGNLSKREALHSSFDKLRTNGVMNLELIDKSNTNAVRPAHERSRRRI
jgi:hypothetical protein